MSNIKQRIIAKIDGIISRNTVISAVSIVMLGIYLRDREYIRHGLLRRRHNKAVLPLMDIGVLSERIDYVRNLAQADDKIKVFYIISKKDSPGAGLFAFVTAFFAQIIYALAKGMIPVIDMQNHPSSYLEEGELGKVNAWEKFFKQPCGYGLDDISGEKVIYSFGAAWQTVLPITNQIKDYDLLLNKHLDLWAAMYSSFFSVNDAAAQYIEQEYRTLFKPGMRVIGVHFRGTDYTQGRPAGFPVQPSSDDVIEKVSSMMPVWKCDYVFVATEERKTISAFEAAFPGRVLTSACRYYDEADDVDFSEKFNSSVRFDRANDVYLKGLEYLTAVILLSRCNCAVLGVCGGSMAALFVNGGKYERTHIFDLGFYS